MSFDLINQITLDCLLNKDYVKNYLNIQDKKNKSTEDCNIYRNRILELTTQLIDGSKPDNLHDDVLYAYNNYINACIHHFKFVDNLECEDNLEDEDNLEEEDNLERHTNFKTDEWGDYIVEENEENEENEYEKTKNMCVYDVSQNNVKENNTQKENHNDIQCKEKHKSTGHDYLADMMLINSLQGFLLNKK